MRLIDADDYCKACGCSPPYGNDGECVNCCICDCPTIEAEPVRHGYWIGVQFDEFFECSVCGDLTDWKLYDYCPNCGAKMDGDPS